MGIIKVEGLGLVEIEGERPNAKEAAAIEKKYEAIQDQRKTADGVDKLQKSEINLGRLGLEVGLSIVGTIATGGLALPALAARGAMLARPFLVQLGKSALGSAAGGGTGAGLAQTFDPKDDIVKEIVRGAYEGAAGELIGAPIAIKGGQLISKTFNKMNPRQYVKPLEDAHEAEKILFVGGGEGLTEATKKGLSQADAVLKNPEKYADRFYDVDTVTRLAKEAKKGLTVGMKTESRFLDTVENIAEGSFFGAEELLGRKEALSFIGQTYRKDFADQLTKNINNTDMGQLFFDTLTGSGNTRKTYFKAAYNSIDDILKKQGDKIPTKIPSSSIKKSLDDFVKREGLPSEDILSLQKQFAKRVANKPTLSFSQLNKVRSELLRDQRDVIASATPNAAKGQAYGAMIKGIDGIMDDIAKGGKNAAKYNVPQEAVERLREVNKFYKDTSGVFEDSIIADILKKGNKDGGVDQIFSAIVKGKNKPATIRTLFSRIDELATKKQPVAGLTTEAGEAVPETFLTKDQAKNLKDSLRGQWLSNTFEKSKLGGTQIVDAKKFANQLDDNRIVYEELFNNAQRDQIDKVIKNLSVAQGTLDKKTGLPGKVFIQLKQAGALGQVLSMGGRGQLGSALLDKGIATVLIAPAALSKLMLQPKISSLIFKEYTKENFEKMTPSAAGVLFRQTVGRLAEEGLIDADEAFKAIEESKVVEKEMIDAGIKNAKDLGGVAQQRQNLQQQTIRPAPTNMGLPSLAPAQVASGPVTTDRQTTYQGLFPMDPTGQAIARRG